MNIHPRFHLGTSGWSYPWQDIFYPSGLLSADYLSYYATRFDCTEINSSFYHYTMAKTIEKWLATTPAAFHFAPKLNQEITHVRKLVDVEAPLDKFMSRFLLMGERLGPILIQIAASLKFDPKMAASFFSMLHQKYPGQSFAFEARHISWFSESCLNILREHHIASVIANSGGRFPEVEAVTSEIVYLRLHGDSKLYDSNYATEHLEKYAFMIREWLCQGKKVWVFFNNTMRAQAITDSAKLNAILGEIMPMSLNQVIPPLVET